LVFSFCHNFHKVATLDQLTKHRKDGEGAGAGGGAGAGAGATTPRWMCVVLSSNANLPANLFAAASTFHFVLLIKI
jgi:hypothetical protein